MKPTSIPTRQDDPPWLLFFRADEVLPFFILFIVGIITHNLLICIVLGWGFSYVYKKINSRFSRGFVLHWLYSKGLWLFSMSRTLSNPFNKRYISARNSPDSKLKKIIIKR